MRHCGSKPARYSWQCIAPKTQHQKYIAPKTKKQCTKDALHNSWRGKVIPVVMHLSGSPNCSRLHIINKQAKIGIIFDTYSAIINIIILRIPQDQRYHWRAVPWRVSFVTIDGQHIVHSHSERYRWWWWWWWSLSPTAFLDWLGAISLLNWEVFNFVAKFTEL